MAVKHTDPDTLKTIVHSGYKGSKTGCGIDTKVNPSHWANTILSVTCDKNGCKN